MIKKKHLKNPQWLRDIKSKRYSIFRADILFSNKKYRDILFVDNGGWHFSYLKDAKGVKDKLKSIRHHVDYELNPVSTEKLDNMILNSITDAGLTLTSEEKTKVLSNVASYRPSYFVQTS